MVAAQSVMEVVIDNRNSKMHIKTCSGSDYSYLRRTNEIVNSTIDEGSFAWEFEPLQYFTSLPNVDTFIISITEQCNLRCSYCCYSGSYKNNRSHNTSSMSANDIEEVLMFVQGAAKDENIKLAFYGGEPLLNIDLLRYAIGKAHEMWGQKVSISVSSNATLLTPDIIDWLFENRVRIDISIDGTKEWHDKYRIDRMGNGSFEKVYQALSYIKVKYPTRLQDDVLVLMTVSNIEDLKSIDYAWSQDSLLKNIKPTKISSILPNFNDGVERQNYEHLASKYLSLLEIYELRKDSVVLSAFFEQCIAYWLNRPIIDVGNAVPMATCLPLNNKLYIDAQLNIGVCEKIADKFRIGTISSGINWDLANIQVKGYYERRFQRCRFCPAIRMCDMCFAAIEYNDEEWDILCHNEKVYTKVCFRIFCEMAERGMIS